MLQKPHARGGQALAQGTCKTAPQVWAGAENAASTNDIEQGAPPQTSSQRQSQLGEVGAGLGAKASRHPIALAGRSRNQREKRGHLLSFKLLEHNLCDHRKLQSLANPRGQHGVLAAPVEITQSRHDGLTSQVIARPGIVKQSAPTAGAQGFASLVTRVSDGTCARNHDHPRSSSQGGVQSNRRVRRQEVVPRGDRLAEPRQ